MDVASVAKLANLPLKKDQEEKFTAQFADTLKTISIIDELDTSNVIPTSQVTGLTNVMRSDEIDFHRQFTNDQALSQAAQTHNGYIVVPRVIDE